MRRVLREIIYSSEPEVALQKKLQLNNDEIVYGRERIKLGKAVLISFGKASLKMASWALKRKKFERCIVVSHSSFNFLGNEVEFYESSHPYPDERSVAAANAIIECLEKESYMTALFMISGGGSSLVELPAIDLHDITDANKKLVSSGLSIKQINSVRKHLSLIKGGKLASHCKGRIVNIIVSDVIGNDISTVSCGPTVSDRTSFSDALRAARKAMLNERVINYLQQGKEGKYRETERNVKSKSIVVLSNKDVVKAVRKVSVNPVVLKSRLSNVNQACTSLSSVFSSCMNSYKKFTVIAGGEPEVELKGKQGNGGRNSELCLLLALKLRGMRYNFLAYATDGKDGNSTHAGAITDQTLEGEEIEKYIESKNTYDLLEKLCMTVDTGNTNTNVNNLYVLTPSEF